MGSGTDDTMAIVAAFADLGERYTSGRLSASNFADELTNLMTVDVVFCSNYEPSWEPLRRLFQERYGIADIVERYEYEGRNERIDDDSGMPTDLCVSGDLVYYTQNETASFFDGPPVTWEMMTKL